MPRKPRVPSYCLHKASGQAVVRINGRDCYLGPFGSDESHAEYARLIAEWRSGRQDIAALASAASSVADPSISVSEVLLKYRDFAKRYYSKDGATPSVFVLGGAEDPDIQRFIDFAWPHPDDIAGPHSRQTLQLNHGRHLRRDNGQNGIDVLVLHRLDRICFPSLSPPPLQPWYGPQSLVDRGRDQFFRNGPFEKPFDPILDHSPRKIRFNHALTNGLQFERTEFTGKRMAIELTDRF